MYTVRQGIQSGRGRGSGPVLHTGYPVVWIVAPRTKLPQGIREAAAGMRGRRGPPSRGPSDLHLAEPAEGAP